MSIVVLKRKTYNNNPRISPISGGHNNNLGFSINNPSNSATTNNVNLLNGKSSCCNSANTLSLKPSVKTYRGYYSTKYNSCPCNIVQPFNTGDNHLDSQGLYIYKKSIECQTHPNDISNTSDVIKTYTDCNCKPKNISYAKPYKVVSHSEYLKIYMRKNSFLFPPCEPHTPAIINTSSCS